MSFEESNHETIALTEDQEDILIELLNIGMGKSASLLNEMLERPVDIKIPKIKLLQIGQLKDEEVKLQFDKFISAVSMEFAGVITGKTALVFPPESAHNLVKALTGEQPGTPEMDSVTVETLSEIGNIVINSVMGSLSNSIGECLEYFPPVYTEDSLSNVAVTDDNCSDRVVLLAEVAFSISNLQISGEVILTFDMGSLNKLTSIFDSMA